MGVGIASGIGLPGECAFVCAGVRGVARVGVSAGLGAFGLGLFSVGCGWVRRHSLGRGRVGWLP